MIMISKKQTVLDLTALCDAADNMMESANVLWRAHNPEEDGFPEAIPLDDAQERHSNSFNALRRAVYYGRQSIDRLAVLFASCSVDYPDLANHPTTTELEDGRVQITLSAEEWRAIREASR